MRPGSWLNAPWHARREAVRRLLDIQEAFQRFLLTGDSDISACVVGTERVPVATRLGIYGDGYRSRLIEALQASFPVLADLLGETDFEALAARYVSGHESTFFSIRYYGDRLADFLAGEAHYSQVPLLAELARWEWAMAAAFDAADAEPIDSSAFAQLAPQDWAELHFEWSPAVQVVELEWNVPQLWKAVTEGTPRPEPSLGSEAADAGAPRAVSYVIWRRELQIYFRPLAREEAQVIAAARGGHSFGELCVLLCEHLDESEAALHAAGYLRGWVESGLITAIG
jgi:Putative DNA-binding domain